MFIIRNALLSISRSKGRSILIGMIVLTIAASCSVALAIRTAAVDAKENGMANVAVTGTIARNPEKFRIDFGSSGGSRPDQSAMEEAREELREIEEKYPMLTLEQYEKYAQNENVQGAYYQKSIYLDAAGDLTAVTQESSGSNMGGFTSRGGIMSMGDFTITGVSGEQAMTRFLNGQSKLEEGDSLPDFEKDDYSCVISSDLAGYNGLQTGDKIKLVNSNNEEESYTFKIVGIYTNLSNETDSSPMMSNAMNPANNIYVSAKSVDKIEANSAKNPVAIEEEEDDAGMGGRMIIGSDLSGEDVERTSEMTASLSYTYSFADKAAWEDFGKAVVAELGDYYSAQSSDADSYEESLRPLEDLGNYAMTFLLVVLIIGGAILFFLNIFFVLVRKYEVGVLTAIGVKKNKVAAQFVAELLIVTLLAVAIGGALGAAASVPVSNKLLEGQIEEMQTSQNNQNEAFGRRTDQGGGGFNMNGGFMGGSRLIGGEASTPVEYLSQVNAAVNPLVLLQLLGIGLLLTVLSGLSAVVFVMRYEPLKILAERS